MGNCLSIDIEIHVDGPIPETGLDHLVKQIREDFYIGEHHIDEDGEGSTFLVFDGLPGNYASRFSVQDLQEKARDIVWEFFGRYVLVSVNVVLHDLIPRDYVEWMEEDYDHWKPIS